MAATENDGVVIDQKIGEACDAIACFGFPEEQVRDTLKTLVALYDNEWTFIEEDNYRVVVDMLVKDGLLGGEAKAKAKKAELHSTEKRARMSNSGHARDKGKNLVVSHVASTGTNSHFQERADNMYTDNGCSKPSGQKLSLSVAALHPVSKLSTSSTADDSKLQDLKASGKRPNVDGDSTVSQIDIASSSNKEVKISLVCDASEDYYAQKKRLAAVLSKVERECCRKYTIQDPDFSLRKLMGKVCKGFLEMDTDSREKSNICAPSLLDSKKKLSEKDRGNKDNYQSTPALQPSKLNGRKCHQLIFQDVRGASQNKKIKVLEPTQSSNPQCNFQAVLKKYPIYLMDIARGEERVQIPLVDETGSLELPNFMYIKNNMIYKDAHVDFSLDRISDVNCCAQCLGDCLSSEWPCACAGETRGEFVYTPDGLLKEEFLHECIATVKEPQRKHYYYCEICPLQNDLQRKGRKIKPCKGHLTRKFIKECWFKCGCNKKCGNRVVQRGIQVPLQVFATPEGKGWGVRCVRALKKGTFVCEYVGEIVTNQELFERNKERLAKDDKHTYPVLLDADWGSERILKDEEALCLDATELGNVCRFINHRCYDANLIEIPVEVETPDHHYYHIAFFTTRNIEPMEELTWDYGIVFDDIYHPVKAFECKCGSKHCQYRKKPNRSN